MAEDQAQDEEFVPAEAVDDEVDEKQATRRAKKEGIKLVDQYQIARVGEMGAALPVSYTSKKEAEKDLDEMNAKLKKGDPQFHIISTRHSVPAEQ